MRHRASLSLKILILLVFTCGFGFSDVLGAENKEGIEKILTPGLYPEIQFEEMSHDFGKTFQNKTLEHLFYFKNIGTGNLHILKVKAG